MSETTGGQKIQLLGLCRFSYPTAQDGFQSVQDTAEAQRRALYGPERLAQRMFFFRNLVVPCLQGQSDPDFTLLVLVGDGLPKLFRAELEALAALVPQMKIVERPDGQPHLKTCREVMLAHRDQSAKVVGEFNLDDDDAVAVDFIAEARKGFAVLRPAWSDFGRKAVLDFNNGIAMEGAGQGTLSFERCAVPFWAVAKCLYLKPTSSRSLQDFNHLRIWRNVPAMTLPRPAMFIRGVHDTNDSGVARSIKSAKASGIAASGKLDQKRLPVVLKERFNVDLAALQSGWSALAK